MKPEKFEHKRLLLVGDWTEAGGGHLASRVVLVEWVPNEKWSVHFQVRSESGKLSLHQGYYYHTADSVPRPFVDAAQNFYRLNERSTA